MHMSFEFDAEEIFFLSFFFFPLPKISHDRKLESIKIERGQNQKFWNFWSSGFNGKRRKIKNPVTKKPS